MNKYICKICGYVYDEAAGLPEAGIAKGTTWEAVPSDFVCPLCKASKDNFKQEGVTVSEPIVAAPIPVSDSEKGFTPLEMSILCSNLARGCEKQYLSAEQAQFTALADYFKGITVQITTNETDPLLNMVHRDLKELIPYAHQVAQSHHDRGALRTLVWDEKVTLILNSLLDRYHHEGGAMLENQDVFVCTICGYIHIGDAPPTLCPICKVRSDKFEKIEGGDQ